LIGQNDDISAADGFVDPVNLNHEKDGETTRRVPEYTGIKKPASWAGFSDSVPVSII